MNKFNVKIGEENLVCQGKPYEQSIWGEYQFPFAYITAKGEISVNVHTNDDSAECYGMDNLWRVSADGGISWFTDQSAKLRSGVLLPSGDRLFREEAKPFIIPVDKIKSARIATSYIPSDIYPPVSEKNGEFPEPNGVFRDCWGQVWYTYLIDNLPKGIMNKAFPIFRIKKGESEGKLENAPVDFKYMSMSGALVENKKLVLSRPWAYGGFTVAPDGALWLTSYMCISGLHPENGAYVPFSYSLFFRSTDNGKSFKLASYIPYVPDVNENPDAYKVGGYNETALAFAPDGTATAIIRSTEVFHGGREWAPSYISHSVDGGFTWEKPVRFDEIGVQPRIISLKCGVTLAAYGRPGIYVRASFDKSARVWEKPIEIMTPEDRSHLANNPPERPNFHQWAGSCCNVDLVATGENTAMIFYSDFYYPDEKGGNKKLKSILCKTITVESL